MIFFRNGVTPFAVSIAIVGAASVFLAADYLWPGKLITNDPIRAETAKQNGKSMAERIREANERSSNVKGVYMTSIVASDNGRAATKLRGDIVSLLDETELNGVVIDVKETEGGFVLTDQLHEFIRLLHEKNVWVIARIAVFKDSSQEKIHPEWYLSKKDGKIWRDYRGGSWLDPADPNVWEYQVGLSKQASDAGFDEIQFDYVRFPSDGDIKNALYPVYDGKRAKYEVLREFFSYANQNLKRYRPELILSADLFGYVAIQQADLGIGQRLEDIGKNFDYISLMVYPSHYYSGFEVPKDPSRNLAALFYPYRSTNAASIAVNQPFDIVYRSLLLAEDTLSGRATSTFHTATSTPASAPNLAHARLRPWLQDFDLGVDSSRGIYYDAAKVRAQIDGAEKAGASGWLLWNPNNVYTKAALKPE